MGLAQVLWGRLPLLLAFEKRRRAGAAAPSSSGSENLTQQDLFDRAPVGDVPHGFCARLVQGARVPRQVRQQPAAVVPEARLGALALSGYEAQALCAYRGAEPAREGVRAPRTEQAQTSDAQMALFLYEVLTRSPRHHQLATVLNLACSLVDLLVRQGGRLTPKAREQVERALLAAMRRIDFEAMVKAVPGFMVAHLCDDRHAPWASFAMFIQSRGVRQAMGRYGPAPKAWFKPLCALRDTVVALPASEPELRTLLHVALHRVAHAASLAGDIAVIDHLRDVDFSPLLQGSQAGAQAPWPRALMLMRLGDVTAEFPATQNIWTRWRQAPIFFSRDCLLDAHSK